MELRSLRYVLAVVEEGSFRRAARRLVMTQPPLSREVRRLERELGVELFDRTSRPVALTLAGEAFVVEARTVLARLDHAVEVARRAADRPGRLRVGFQGAVADGILPATVRRFREAHPGVALVLEEHDSGLAQLADLREHRIDLALVRERTDEPGLGSVTVLHEPIVALLPADHRLAGSRSPLGLEELAGEPIVFPARASAPASFDNAIKVLARLGGGPPVVQEVLGVQAILGLVAAGMGISLLPVSVTTLRREGVVSRPLRDPAPTIPLCAVWHDEVAAPLVAGFVATLQEEADVSSPPGMPRGEEPFQAG